MDVYQSGAEWKFANKLLAQLVSKAISYGMPLEDIASTILSVNVQTSPEEKNVERVHKYGVAESSYFFPGAN